MTIVPFPRPSEHKKGDLDVICFCHLRWDFVFQRPQHLMTRFGRQGRVFLIEEPVFHDDDHFQLDISDRGEGIFICVPRANRECDPDKISSFMRAELDKLILKYEIEDYIAWFYTPMMLPWAGRLKPQAVIYDCMDELSGFKNAPAELIDREKDLFARADLVFTGGHSLFQAKKGQHDDVHAFPSSIDKDHFSRAIIIKEEKGPGSDNDRAQIGFVGVIDERFDIPLLRSMADLKPEWDFIMVGPVVKIDENELPRNENIKYLGQRAYGDLPAILADWDVAMMPFALNDSTKYISPTKTPEYLAAGLPVVSTPITDVVRPYGELGLVSIASTPEAFVAAIHEALESDHDARRRAAADFLKKLSWDATFQSMLELIEGVRERREARFSASAG